jgi:hypothetical protein
MRRSAVLAAACTLVLAPEALAGGWATVSVSADPGTVAAGAKRATTLRVLQHGRTPLGGLHPVFTISRAGEQDRRFPAVATGAVGSYRATLVFPEPGLWQVRVADGFTQTHRLAPVRVVAGDGKNATGAAAAPARRAGGGGGSSPTGALVAGAAIVALIVAGAGWLLLRTGRPEGAPDPRRSPRPSAS